MAPALACGCTIVMKPSEITPLTALVSTSSVTSSLRGERCRSRSQWGYALSPHTPSPGLPTRSAISGLEPAPRRDLLPAAACLRFGRGAYFAPRRRPPFIRPLTNASTDDPRSCPLGRGGGPRLVRRWADPRTSRPCRPSPTEHSPLPRCLHLRPCLIALCDRSRGTRGRARAARTRRDARLRGRSPPHVSVPLHTRPTRPVPSTSPLEAV